MALSPERTSAAKPRGDTGWPTAARFRTIRLLAWAVDHRWLTHRRRFGAGVAMSGPGVLLATKLHMPRPPPGFVPRRRLVEALGEGLVRGRVLVSAPAGFGKTALLADWARGGGRPVAWLGLDDDDSDPARFWRYAVAALDRARPGLAGAGKPAAQAAAPAVV